MLIQKQAKKFRFKQFYNDSVNTGQPNSQYFIHYLVQQGYSLYQLSTELKVHGSTLRRIVNGITQKPHSVIFKRLLRVYCTAITSV